MGTAEPEPEPEPEPDPDRMEEGDGDGDETEDPGDLTAEEVLSQVAQLFAERSSVLSQSPPDEVRAAELLEEISALLQQAAQLDGIQVVIPDPASVDA